MTVNNVSKKHWARPGMIIGIILAIIAYGLALVSEATMVADTYKSYKQGGQ
jgi:hypothetical protein